MRLYVVTRTFSKAIQPRRGAGMGNLTAWSACSAVHGLPRLVLKIRDRRPAASSPVRNVGELDDPGAGTSLMAAMMPLDANHRLSYVSQSSTILLRFGFRS